VLGHRKWTRGNLWSKVLNQGRAYTPRECGKLSIIMFCKLLKSRIQYIGSAKLYLMFYFKFNSSKMEWGLTFAKIKRSNFCLPTWVECPGTVRLLHRQCFIIVGINWGNGHYNPVSLASCLILVIYVRAFIEYVCGCVLFQDVTVCEIRGR